MNLFNASLICLVWPDIVVKKITFGIEVLGISNAKDKTDKYIIIFIIIIDRNIFSNKKTIHLVY